LKHSRKIAQESTEEWGDYGHQNDRGIINQIKRILLGIVVFQDVRWFSV
jgi:hypothetical protein